MRGVKKNTQKIFASLFLSVLVFQGVLGCAASVHAQETIQTPVQSAVQGGAATASVKEGQGIATGDVSTGCNIGNITGCLKDFSLWLLNLIRSAIILIIASPAAALFVWVVNPANVSGPNGILNFPAVYTLWQFIRDFFNLFFIFILLFSAFATIFQVDSFNIRNIFKNILLTALLINFSFPITRFLIDVANVPMYYFINDVIGAGGGQGAVIAMNNLLGFSGTAAAALTTEYIPTFAAIIFAFLFGISLAVLSVMLIVRLIALTLLLVFSPIGFAGSLLPGFNKYGQEWWSKFWNYAFFGPAAALMLVVSLKFLEATQTANVWRSVDQVSTNASVSASGSTLITNVIFYTIPIILIWATIGLANKFAIAGSAAVVGMGYGAAHWTRKKVQNGAMWATKKTVLNPVTRGVGQGVAQRFNDNKLVKWAKAPSKTEARVRGAVGTGTVKGELKKIGDERVRKLLKENKEKGVTAEEHLETLRSGKASEFEKRAAALSLAQEGEIRTATQLADALEAVRGNADEFNQVLDKAKPEAIGSMGATENHRITTLLNERKADGTPVYGTRQADLQQAYSTKLKKENKIEYRIEAELAKAVSSGTGPINPMKVYADNLKMGAKDLSKQSGIIQNAKADGADPTARAYFQDMAQNQKDYFEKVLRSDELKQEDMKVLLEIQNSVGTGSKQVAQSPTGETVSEGGIVIPQSHKPRGDNR